MRIGIGLPNPVPGTPGDLLVRWAQRAEERGFTGLATIDRIAYPSHDSLATLAAAAAVTDRIGLMTNILLAPVYPPAVLAKAAATIDQISGGRLTLGLAVGGRPDDYAAVRRDFDTRGVDFDAALDVIHRAWQGEPLVEGSHPSSPVPTHDERIPIMIGGGSRRAIQRTVRWGVGWTAAGVGPEAAGQFAQQVRTAWQEAGRNGAPKLAALTYYSLGADAEEASRHYLRHYYGFLDEYADQIAESGLRTEAAIRDAIRGYADQGFDELYLDPTVADLDQVDRLADVAL